MRSVECTRSGAGGHLEGGTFEKGMTLMNDDASITISDGLFDGEVFTGICRFPLSISGGLFTKAVDGLHVSTRPIFLSPAAIL